MTANSRFSGKIGVACPFYDDTWLANWTAVDPWLGVTFRDDWN